MWYLRLHRGAAAARRRPVTIAGLFYLSKAGFSFPTPVWGTGPGAGLAGGAGRHRAGLGLPALGAAPVRSHRPGPQPVLGRRWRSSSAARCSAGSLGGAPTAWSIPKHSGSPMEGGASLTPEFLAVLLGLVMYTAAFIAEVVRAGIASVAHGQVEAAGSLGLTRGTGDAARDPAAGAARDHPAAHQPVPEPHQELVARGGDRLPRRGVDRQHGAEPDRPRGRVHRDHHGGVPDDVAVDLGVHELVQPRAAIKER